MTETMRKILLFAFVCMSMSVLAQHVTPLNIRLTEVNLDSLRAMHRTEPRVYRTALDVLEQGLMQNAEEIKAAKTELKAEKAHAKQLDASLKEASKLAKALSKLYDKESGEVKALQSAVTKQQEEISHQTALNKETRELYLRFLSKQQDELGYVLRDVADRQRAITDLENSIQKGHSIRHNFVLETEVKAKDITALESQLKSRMAKIKNEKKSAK